MVDIVVNGLKLWDNGLDLTGTADAAFEHSIQAECFADMLRIKTTEEYKITMPVFKCACHAMAYAALRVSPNYRDCPVKITDELIEQTACAYHRYCRTHRFNALACVNAVRVKEGLNVILPDDNEYDVRVCSSTTVDTTTSTVSCHCVLATTTSTGPNHIPGELMKKTPSVVDLFANRWHPDGFTLSEGVKWYWHAFGGVLPCVHCRPHLSVMTRHWLKMSNQYDAQMSVATLSASVKRNTQHKALVDSIDTTPFLYPAASNIKQKLDSIKSHSDRLNKDYPDYTYHPKYTTSGISAANSVKADVQQHLSYVVAMKNAVNALRIANDHPLGALKPSYPVVAVREKYDVFGALAGPEDFWVTLIQISLCYYDDPQNSDLSDVQSAHIMVSARRKELARVIAATGPPTSIFDKALLGEQDDDDTWRLFETGPARGAAFMFWLEITTVLMSVHPRYETLVGMFWPIPKHATVGDDNTTATARYRRATWFIRQQWAWYLKTNRNPLALVHQIYMNGSVSTILSHSNKKSHILHHRALFMVAEFNKHGGNDQKWLDEYVEDTLGVYLSFLM